MAMYQQLQSLYFCGDFPSPVPIFNATGNHNYYGPCIPFPNFDINDRISMPSLNSPIPLVSPWASNIHTSPEEVVEVVEDQDVEAIDDQEEPLDLSCKKVDKVAALQKNEPTGTKRAFTDVQKEICVPIYVKKWKWKEDGPQKQKTRKQLKPKQNLGVAARPTPYKIEGSTGRINFQQADFGRNNQEKAGNISHAYDSKGVVVVHLGDGDVGGNFEKALGTETWNQIVQQKAEQMKTQGENNPAAIIESIGVEDLTGKFVPESKIIIIDNSEKRSVDDHFAQALGADTWSSIQNNRNGSGQANKISKRSVHREKQVPARPIPIRPVPVVSSSTQIFGNRPTPRYNVENLLGDICCKSNETCSHEPIPVSVKKVEPQSHVAKNGMRRRKI